MPKFVDVFDKALEIAKGVEDYESARLISSPDGARDRVITGMSVRQLRAYDEVMRAAYFQLLGQELTAKANA